MFWNNETKTVLVQQRESYKTNVIVLGLFGYVFRFYHNTFPQTCHPDEGGISARLSLIIRKKSYFR